MTRKKFVLTLALLALLGAPGALLSQAASSAKPGKTTAAKSKSAAKKATPAAKKNNSQGVPATPSSAPASKPASAPANELDLNAMFNGQNMESQGPFDYNTPTMHLSCDFVTSNSDSKTFHAWSTSSRPVVLDVKDQHMHLTCTDWKWDGNAKVHTLSQNAHIIQKNEKGEETLNIAGETIWIVMQDDGQMDIRVQQGDQPGSKQASMKMKDFKAADQNSVASAQP